LRKSANVTEKLKTKFASAMRSPGFAVMLQTISGAVIVG
jgi:hypothetical protein